jgi:hypothetical protein
MVKKEDVLAAIDAIVAEGGKLTRETVTRRLGGGSPNEIAPILKSFKEERRKQVPPEVRELLDAYQLLGPFDQKIFREDLMGKPKGKKKRGKEQ